MKHVLILLFSVLPLAIKPLMTNINFSQSVSNSSVDSGSANMADISKQCDHFVSATQRRSRRSTSLTLDKRALAVQVWRRWRRKDKCIITQMPLAANHA